MNITEFCFLASIVEVYQKKHESPSVLHLTEYHKTKLWLIYEKEGEKAYIGFDSWCNKYLQNKSVLKASNLVDGLKQNSPGNKKIQIKRYITECKT